ncbi:unannotated protein [freshwater metagenome]|uniref:Unannotated protein n=1 Tax=freshwater metagenome TaxID=449393 RepID=A0A6J7DVC2_9ZZZZ
MIGHGSNSAAAPSVIFVAGRHPSATAAPRVNGAAIVNAAAIANGSAIAGIHQAEQMATNTQSETMRLRGRLSASKRPLSRAIPSTSTGAIAYASSGPIRPAAIALRGSGITP